MNHEQAPISSPLFKGGWGGSLLDCVHHPFRTAIRRKVGRKKAIELISAIPQILKVASITEAVIASALKSPMSDFEDAVTSFAADLSGAELIITRNGSDFAQSSVCPLSPDEFLAHNYSQVPQDGAG